MRGGKSELTIGVKKENLSKGGLKKDYAFMWSYGKQETFTFILPNYTGSSNDPSEFGENSKVITAFQESGLPNDAVNYFYRYMFFCYPRTDLIDTTADDTDLISKSPVLIIKIVTFKKYILNIKQPRRERSGLLYTDL
jgi:hypothetical protein